MTTDDDAHRLDTEALDVFLPKVEPQSAIGLLGGSFNPPHLGHSMLALCAISSLPLRELWVLPCADHPFGKDLAPFESRIAMCQATFRQLAPFVKVIEIEAKLPVPNFTVQTLRVIRSLREGIELHWIAGSDLHEDLHRWREPEALPTLAKIVTVERQGHTQKGFLGFPLPEISSSMVRHKVRNGFSVSGLLEAKTIQLIESLGLYRSTPETAH